MDRRTFLKRLTGVSLGLAGVNLAMPRAVKASLLRPVTAMVASGYLDNRLKSRIAAFKARHPGWRIGETHCHSAFSDGSYDVGPILGRAAGLGLDFIVITEHLLPYKHPLECSLLSIAERFRCVQTWNRNSRPPPTVYPGIEVSTEQGHLILVFPEEFLQPRNRGDILRQFSRIDRRMDSMEATAKLIQPFGGFSIIPHPNRKRIYPFGVSTEFVRKNLMGLVDAIEDISTGHGYVKNYSDELGLASIGSSDDHFNFIIGTTVTAFDSARHVDFPTAVRARATRAVKLDDSLDDLFAAARILL